MNIASTKYGDSKSFGQPLGDSWNLAVDVRHFSYERQRESIWTTF